MIPYGRRRMVWNRWDVVAALGAMMVGFAVTADAWIDIFTIAWKDEEASHVLLVPFILPWLVWVRRGRLVRSRRVRTMAGPLAVAIGWLLCWYGYNENILAFTHGGSVLIVVGCLLSVVGAQVLFQFLPAFIVLVFLVPMPASIRLAVSLPLQESMARLTQAIFEIMGVGLERSGNVLTINGVDVAIAEACNGLRMVFTLVLVSYAFAFGTPLRPYLRLLILAAALPSAILCNVVRMIPTVWLYGRSGEEFWGWPGVEVADVFHTVSGWVMVVVAFGLLMGVIRLLRWSLIPVARYTLAAD